MAMFQKYDICYSIYGMGDAIPEAINQRYSNMTYTSNQAGFTIIILSPIKKYILFIPIMVQKKSSRLMTRYLMFYH
jgi:hypothetical protein